jgi:hypothetical protein
MRLKDIEIGKAYQTVMGKVWPVLIDDSVYLTRMHIHQCAQPEWRIGMRGVGCAIRSKRTSDLPDQWVPCVLRSHDIIRPWDEYRELVAQRKLWK